MTEQERLAKAAQKVADAMAELRDAWIDAEGCDDYGHPVDIPGYPFKASLDDLSGAVDAFAVKAKLWADDVEKDAQAAAEAEEAEAPDANDDAEWRREMAMEAGMLHGVEAYNDAMGCGVEDGEDR